MQITVATAKSKTIVGASTISAATNTTPIAITTTAAHGLETGDVVQNSGVIGNLAANGNFVVTVTSSTAFTLNNSNGSGAYTSGGSVAHIGYATPAALIDNTVLLTPKDFTLVVRIEASSPGSTTRFQFEDTADLNFVTGLPVAQGATVGGFSPASDYKRSWKKEDEPDLRQASPGNNLRLKMLNSTVGATFTFSAWMEY